MESVLFLLSTMALVMANCAERNEVLLDVFASGDMMFDVVQFQMPRVGRIPFITRPSTLLALVPISTQYLPPSIVGNPPIMFRALPVGLQHVDSDAQIRPSRVSGSNRPAMFCSQSPYPPRPLGFVPSDISKLLAGDFLPYILSEKIEDSPLHGARQ